MASMLGSCAKALLGFNLLEKRFVFVIWTVLRSMSATSASTRRRTASAKSSWSCGSALSVCGVLAMRLKPSKPLGGVVAVARRRVGSGLAAGVGECRRVSCSCVSRVV